MTGSLAPPPPYGSEQGSILLETGREGLREPVYEPGHSRTRSGLARMGFPAGSSGPVRSHTDISLSHLAHISSQDVSTGTNTRDLDVGDIQHQPIENTPAGQQIIPPPEYSSPQDSPRSSEDGDDAHTRLLQERSSAGQPPRYDAAVSEGAQTGPSRL